MDGFLIQILVAAASTAVPLPPAVPAPTPMEGYLHQRVAVLIYGDRSGKGEPPGAEWILAREIRSFEAFLWRQSKRRLFVDTVRIQPGRRLERDEFLYGGTRWGYLPKFSPEMASDLNREGWNRSEFDAVLILYEPVPGRGTPLAGATYLPEGISAIPLVEATFRDAGRRHPLHRLLVHEFLHQMEFAFRGLVDRPYLIDPDGVDGGPCPPAGKEDLEQALRWNSGCSEIEWSILSPARGEWVPR